MTLEEDINRAQKIIHEHYNEVFLLSVPAIKFSTDILLKMWETDDLENDVSLKEVSKMSVDDWGENQKVFNIAMGTEPQCYTKIVGLGLGEDLDILYLFFVVGILQWRAYEKGYLSRDKLYLSNDPTPVDRSLIDTYHRLKDKGVDPFYVLN